MQLGRHTAFLNLIKTMRLVGMEANLSITFEPLAWRSMILPSRARPAAITRALNSPWAAFISAPSLALSMRS